MSENNNTSKTKRYLNLPALFDRQPELLYKSPYINFLREFRLTRLDFKLQELYHEAARAWSRLSKAERASYRYDDIIKDIKRRRSRSDRIKKEKRRRKYMSLKARYNDRRRKPYAKSRIRRRRPYDRAATKLRNAFADKMIKKPYGRSRIRRRKPYYKTTIRLKRKFAGTMRPKRRQAVRWSRRQKR